MVKVNVKWNKKEFNAVDLSEFQKGIDFKQKMSELTGVPVDRLKVMGLGGLLKDDQDISKLKVKDGAKVTLMGSAETLPEPPVEKVVFAEDIAGGDDTDAVLQQYPSGLANMGNTCYANSALQTLRIIPELRDALNDFKGSSTANDLAESVTASLRDLLNNLDGTHNALTPTTFLTSFRKAHPIFDEKTSTPLGDMHAQQDADEFLHTLLNTIAQRLKGDVQLDEISKLFKGSFEVKLQCADADEEPTVMEEEFQKLSCHISQQTSNLTAGIEQSLTGTVKKASPTLNKDALYTRTQKIKKLPPYLMVNFVRFFWKSKEQVKAKVLRDVKFPTLLDVYDFCTEEYKKELQPTRDALRKSKEESLMNKLKGKDSEESAQKRQKLDNDMEIDQEKKKLTETPDTAWYELCGVVTHKGRTANSGHYVGWIKSDTGRWLKFDDDKVSEVSEEEIKKLSGGGDWHIASTLLYRKLNNAP